MKTQTRITFWNDNNEKFWGEGPCRLLREIERTGSLRAAAGSLYMAYTKAFKLLKNAEEALGYPLTVRATGGRNGGGSVLTPEGRAWVEKYEAYREACCRDNEQLFEQYFGGQSARIGCVIMASGEAKRFGENKLMAPFDGVPMIQKVIDAAREALEEIVVVTRHEEVQRLCESLGVRVILHDYPGRNDTIRLGLEALGDGIDACVFCPADQPFVTAESLKMFRAAVSWDKSRIYRASSGEVTGSPVCFPADTFEELRNLPEGKGGGVVINRHQDKVSLIPVDARELIDIDTRDDYLSCIRLLDRMKELVIVRGAGDVATGTIVRLVRAGFPVLLLETDKPTAIRRNVAYSEAVFEGVQTVEGVSCYLARTLEEAMAMICEGKLVLAVDPAGEAIEKLKPMAVIDGILAKRNLGTSRDMAPITIGLGPGFTAGDDVDAVIETQRGHNLGRIIYEGSAAPNTGIPGNIEGFSAERVIYSPSEGIIRSVSEITDVVSRGDVIAYIEKDGSRIPVNATMDGILRGLIRDGYYVREGLKIADIDPRIEERSNCNTVSDKSRCIAGGVLEALMYLKRERGL